MDSVFPQKLRIFVFDFFRKLIVTIVFLVYLSGSEVLAQSPKKSEILNFLATTIDQSRFALVDFDYEVFEDKPSQGRIAISGTLSRTVPMYSKTSGELARNEFLSRGFSHQDFLDEMGYSLRVGAFVEWVLIGEPGSLVQFEAELIYRKKVDGFGFSGRISNIQASGTPQFLFPPNSFIAMSRDWHNYIDRIVDRRSQRTQDEIRALQRRYLLLESTKNAVLGSSFTVSFGNAASNERLLTSSCGEVAVSDFGDIDHLTGFGNSTNLFGYVVKCQTEFLTDSQFGGVVFQAGETEQLFYRVEIDARPNIHGGEILTATLRVSEPNDPLRTLQLKHTAFKLAWDLSHFGFPPMPPVSALFVSEYDSLNSAPSDPNIKKSGENAVCMDYSELADGWVCAEAPPKNSPSFLLVDMSRATAICWALNGKNSVWKNGEPFDFSLEVMNTSVFRGWMNFQQWEARGFPFPSYMRIRSNNDQPRPAYFRRWPQNPDGSCY